MSELLSSYGAQFFWGLSAFIVFAVILYRVAVKQVLAAVDNRESTIARQMKEAEETYAKAKGLKDELDAKMKAAEAKIAAMMAEAQKDAEAHRAAMVDKGRAEIEQIKQRSLQEIDSARGAALLTLRAQIADLTIIVAEKAIGERLDRQKQETLVDAALVNLGTRG